MNVIALSILKFIGITIGVISGLFIAAALLFAIAVKLINYLFGKD